MNNEIFVDWLTASQFYPKGGLPVLTGGVIVWYDAQGLPRLERNKPTSLAGSHDTKLRIGCDGFRVSVSGNVGRFSRADNLYNFGWDGTLEAVNRILMDIDLPKFTPSIGIIGTSEYQRGAVVSRLDITCNYSTSSELSARAVIATLARKSFSRMKRGNSGDESVWFANTRHMIKAYLKSAEMIAHGCDVDDVVYQFAKENGLLRVEVELKHRLLADMKMNDIEDITQAKLEIYFRDVTKFLNNIEIDCQQRDISQLPLRSRVYASAWLAGQDMKGLLSNGTLYRQANILKPYGFDILTPRNIVNLPVKTRIIELTATKAPDWYIQHQLKAVA